ncbi:MAG: sulfatase-like hydrolase/transferase [Crocinitomicaceae bacterium]|nr:sulfatase-like hydrolase/transferase [Crocinitomicaceae bacterium]MDG1776560.1 sulfatase-like hydrolase/transferase [Crocinitomicaceae bacterium]
MNAYKTEHVIIIVIDGSRYSESWGEPTQQFIPHQKNLSAQGVFYSNFYNNGETYTVPGHSAITTGVYENIDNNGTALPGSPSLFQVWRKKYKNPENSAYIIASKDKLEVLDNCTNPFWNNKYQPQTNCGWSGLGSGYRPDSVTASTAINILENNTPNMVLINFRQPDFSAHQNDWNGYISGIQQTDNYINQLWEYIQGSTKYANKTALFITNDHGRHLDSTGGFAYHGDDCEGCRRVSLLAIGPDFNQGVVVDEPHELIDIPTTISKLMHFKFSSGNGKELSELFN